MNQPVKNPARAFKQACVRLCACMRVHYTYTRMHTQYITYTRIPTTYPPRLLSQTHTHTHMLQRERRGEKEGRGQGKEHLCKVDG